MTRENSSNNLKAWRLARGLTQKQVADRLGVTSRTVRNWEKHGAPSWGVGQTENIRKLLEGL